MFPLNPSNQQFQFQPFKTPVTAYFPGKFTARRLAVKLWLPNFSWSFSFSIIPSKEHPGLIFFRMDSLDLLAVQGTLRSLLQHHSSLYSVQFSHSVVSDSLRPHESQHARPPCLSPTSRVRSDSHPLSRWWHPAISSSVVPLSSCPQSLLASESFPMS